MAMMPLVSEVVGVRVWHGWNGKDYRTSSNITFRIFISRWPWAIPERQSDGSIKWIVQPESELGTWTIFVWHDDPADAMLEAFEYERRIHVPHQ